MVSRGHTIEHGILRLPQPLNRGIVSRCESWSPGRIHPGDCAPQIVPRLVLVTMNMRSLTLNYTCKNNGLAQASSRSETPLR